MGIYSGKTNIQKTFKQNQCNTNMTSYMTMECTTYPFKQNIDKADRGGR